MQIQLRPRKPGIELAGLYRRRETVETLIRSLERYQSTRARSVRKCSRPVSQAAA